MSTKIGEQYCTFCHRDEDIFDTTYVPCFNHRECGHVFQTEQELVDATNRDIQHLNFTLNRGVELIPPRTRGIDIDFCPHCAHDFGGWSRDVKP